MEIKVKLDEGAYMPTKSHDSDAGWDLYIPRGKHFKLGAHKTCTVFTGVHMDIPHGFYGEVCNRSGMNFKLDTTLHGSGTIDAGYIGNIGIKLYNDSDHEYELEAGERIAQIIFHELPVIEMAQVDSLDDTERGQNGFGSTGR